MNYSIYVFIARLNAKWGDSTGVFFDPYKHIKKHEKKMSLSGAKIDAFLSVCKRGSVTHAAEDLKITQTGVTQRIRSLEQDLGVTLFLRSKKGMTPTSEGQLLLNHCELLLESESELLSNLDGGPRQPIRISILGFPSIMKWRVIPALNKLSKTSPWLRFELNYSDSMSGVEAIKENKTQIAIIPKTELTLELDSKVLRPQRYFLVVPDSWRSREIQEIVENEAIFDYDEKDRTTYSYLDKYNLNLPNKGLRHLVSSPEGIADFVRLEMGYTVSTDDLIGALPKNSGISVINPEHFIEYEIVLAWHPRDPMPLYFQKTIDAIT